MTRQTKAKAAHKPPPTPLDVCRAILRLRKGGNPRIRKMAAEAIQAAEAGPYYKPKYFDLKYGISDELLRKYSVNGTRPVEGRVRRIPANPKGNRFRYSEPDVRKQWPGRAVLAEDGERTP